MIDRNVLAYGLACLILNVTLMGSVVLIGLLLRAEVKANDLLNLTVFFTMATVVETRGYINGRRRKRKDVKTDA